VAGNPTKLREKDQPGINWGGQGEALQRLVLGFSPGLFDLLAQVSKPTKQPQEIWQELGPLLTNLQAPLVFAPMPIQDAIDLGRFLVHSAIMFSRFLPGPQIVGGPIEVAAITKHEGFKWISRIHYYDQEFLPTPSSSIGGTTMFSVPPSGNDMREYLMSIRRKIEESGVALKTTDELDKEIDEMRGRSR
jgi:hypothetical protein